MQNEQQTTNPLRHNYSRSCRSNFNQLYIKYQVLSGEWMKVSNGSWELTPVDGGTRARYAVEIQIAKPPLIPQAVIDKVTDELTKVQLPRMLDAFKARAEKG